PIIIIGAGMVGLTLAQALHKNHIPFEIYERDAAAADAPAKGRGWALTVHWALSALQECLPPTLFAQLPSIQVDPSLSDTRRFPFLDLATGRPKFIIPPTPRLRVNRRRLGDLLATDLPIHHHKTLSAVGDHPDRQTVTAHFTDGTHRTGSLLIGTDGRSSKTRRLLLGEETGRLNRLPVRSMGATITMTPEAFAPLRAIDPLLFQGCHPDTGVYLWFSLVSSPRLAPAHQDTVERAGCYEGQLIQSWRYSSPADEVPPTHAARLARFKENARGFEPRLREAILNLPEGTRVLPIVLGDWVPVEWESPGGRVTLAGDAAHAMTSYRGEAFNHGVADAAVLAREIASVWGRVQEGDADGAHDLRALGPDSPIVSKRAQVVQEAREGGA
ncbi:FAD/NAD(P)-binding domain-containing protein, partial [Aspergillus indologenus CBS 114.80]